MNKNKSKQKVVLTLVLIATIFLFISTICYVHEAWTQLSYTGIFEKETMAVNFFTGPSVLNWSSAVFSNAYEAKYFYVLLWDLINNTNDSFFRLSLISLVVIIFNYIAGNQSRRKYYISNLVVGLMLPVVAICLAIPSLINAFDTINIMNKVQNDFELFENYRQLGYVISSKSGIFLIVVTFIYIAITICYGVYVALRFVKTYPGLQKNEIENSSAEEASASLNK